MSEEGSNESLSREKSSRSSDPNSELLSRIRSSDLKALNREIPEGMSLRAMDLMTNPSDDDLAKHLVREGKLGIEDALEIVDPEGRVVGSQVLPHAEARYLEELAIAEAARTEKSPSWISSENLLTDALGFDFGGETDIEPQYNDQYYGDISGDDEQPEQNADEEEEKVEEQEIEKPQQVSMKYPRSVESLYQLIEPKREDDFNTQIEQLNRQMFDIQHDICLEHQQRSTLKVKRFMFEKEIIQESISEAGVLYFPGNFLNSLIGRRVDDQDIPFILECVEDIKDFKGFNFAYNEINNEGLIILAEFVRDHGSIVHLNLSHNNFNVDGLHALVTCLMNRPSLHSLKISGMKVGDEGINSITCLYMCGRGPRDLDVSEADMTMPGFQALCSAFQATDDDEDFPKFLTKHKLPFTLETLAQLKMENNDFIRAQTYNRLTHSQFELVPPKEKPPRTEEDSVINVEANNANKMVNPVENENFKTDGINEALEELFTVALGAGDTGVLKTIDLSGAKEEIVRFEQQARTFNETDDFIKEHKIIRHIGCKAARTDGRPVIICPSLYSLEIDEFVDDEDSESRQTQTVVATRSVNPMYMDILVEPIITEEEGRENKEVADTLTAQKASTKFVRDTLKEAGAIGGKTEYTHDSDITQLLLMTILETGKRFLEAEIDGGDLTEPELRTIWEHCMETSMKIFRPAIPSHCTITDETLELFVEQFVKISSRTFYQLLQNPFLYDLFEEAATRGCIETTKERQREEAAKTSSPPSYECILNVVLKFLEEVILKAGEIIGRGDPYNIRGLLLKARKGKTPTGWDIWPSIADMTEEMVEPLVDKFFTAGVLLAQDALTCKTEGENSQEEGIEPARQFLEGIFNELSNFLYQVKDDNQKLAARFESIHKKFTFSTKPVRLVLNRPFFAGYEPIMASKLAAYLRTNESVKCLHLRKWDLGEDGMINLMDGLMYNMNVVTLDLASNGIGAEGMKPLGQYIQKNPNLKHLLLNHNRLRNPGLQVLTDSIKNSKLVSLNVAFNDVTEVGLNPFLHVVRKSKIRSLYILGNCFTQNSCLLLQDLFQKGYLYKPECDVQLQEIDGEGVIVRNSQARDMNEWYEVPAAIDIELVCPPYFMEYYSPAKVTVFGATDVEI